MVTSKTNKVFDVLASHFPEYEIVHRISTPPARKGYSGTMFLYKKSLPEPIITMPEIGAPEPMDSEGRIITLEFPSFSSQQFTHQMRVMVLTVWTYVDNGMINIAPTYKCLTSKTCLSMW